MADSSESIDVAKRYVKQNQRTIKRLEDKVGVTDPIEIRILQETVVRKALIVLLDGGYNVPEANMAIELAFKSEHSMQNAVQKVLGY